MQLFHALIQRLRSQTPPLEPEGAKETALLVEKAFAEKGVETESGSALWSGQAPEDQELDSIFEELLNAVRGGDAQTVRTLVNQYPQSAHRVEEATQCTALLVAAEMGEVDCLKALLPHSNIQAVDADQISALGLACMFGHLECAKILAPMCDVNHRDRFGFTPLLDAITRERVDAIEWLAPLSDLSGDNGHGAWSYASRCAENGVVRLARAADALSAFIPTQDVLDSVKKLGVAAHVQLPRTVARLERELLAQELNGLLGLPARREEPLNGGQSAKNTNSAPELTEQTSMRKVKRI